MAFSEDLDAFMADFGVPVTDGATATIGILDMPADVLAGDQVLSTEYQLTIKASVYPGLGYGSLLSVDGVAYAVRNVKPMDDGRFAAVSLQKV